MATKVGMYPAVHESVTVPVGRDGKIRTALRTDQIVEFVTVTSEKKNDVNGPVHTCLKIFKFVTLSMHILKNIRVHNYHWGNLHVI